MVRALVAAPPYIIYNNYGLPNNHTIHLAMQCTASLGEGFDKNIHYFLVSTMNISLFIYLFGDLEDVVHGRHVQLKGVLKKPLMARLVNKIIIFYGNYVSWNMNTYS